MYYSKFLTTCINKSVNFFPKKRTFWTFLQSNYTKNECERLKHLGPDRTCAEWLIRNGAKLKWVDSDNFTTEITTLPPEGSQYFIKEINAADATIAHHGIPALKFCIHIDRLILHGCNFLQDDALKTLSLCCPPNLKYLQISSCKHITDEGLLSLVNLQRLEQLVLHDLPFVRNKEEVVCTLKDNLSNCEVTYIYKTD